MLHVSGQVESIYTIWDIYVEKRKVSMWEYGLFILWLNSWLTSDIESQLQDLCNREDCLFVQYETCNYEWFSACKAGSPRFQLWHYKKFITPYTAIVDTTKSEEEILAWMKPKGRYNIKLATKKWVVVQAVKKDKSNIEAFYKLMQETTNRDGFSWNTLEYYTTFLNTITDSKLLLAYKDETVIAWGIFVFQKEVSIYYYGASSGDKKYRNLMSPYLLQWEAIKIAKSTGSSVYDFLWVASPDVKNDPLIWVTDFKKKFTKDIRYVSNSYIYIHKKFKYMCISFLRTLLRK